MTLLNPLALALSALAIPIVLMYMLKLRRQPKEVSSTFLWRRAVDDMQANAPWQRLRPNLLLVVQLLALAGLVLTLAQPAYSRTQTYAGDLVLIIDQSYGMQARDVAPSRFVEAQRQARSLAADRSSGSVVSVIGMGVQPSMQIVESEDPGAINRAVDGLQPEVSAPNVLGALTLAASLARSGTPAHVVLLTSRESGISALPLSMPMPVQIVRIGARLHDLGITAFSAIRSAGQTRALVRVSNFGGATASSTLRLTVDGQLVDVRPVTVSAGKQANLFWNRLPQRSKVLRAELTARDNVVMDKTAWAVTSTRATRHVLVVSRRQFFLQAALAVDPSVQLDGVTPNRYTPSLSTAYDLVVFDGMLPRVFPRTNSLFVAPPQGRTGSLHFGGLEGGGSLSAAPDTSSALLQYVDLGDVHVARARQVSLPAWFSPLVLVGNSTLVAAGEQAQLRSAVLAFDLQDSDWPLRVSFPVLVHNLLEYLAPGLTISSATVPAGAAVQFGLPPHLASLVVQRPDGGRDVLKRPFPPYTHTAQQGLYNVRLEGRTGGPQLSFAVDFFPARPAPVSGPAVTWTGASRDGVRRAVTVPRDLAWACGLIVIGLLSAEWWLAYKR